MQTRAFDYVIFDFGGVIINIDYEATIRAFKAMGIDHFDVLYSQATQSDLFDDIETGKISPQHFINGLLRYLPKGITPNQVVEAWNAMILDVPSERVDFLLELRQQYPIYLLSNTNAIHIEKAFQRWDQATDISIHSVFNQVYLSHELGMRKPNEAIFHHVCDEHQLSPEKGLFIDDSIQHIEGARKAGLQAIHLQPGEEIQSIFS